MAAVDPIHLEPEVPHQFAADAVVSAMLLPMNDCVFGGVFGRNLAPLLAFFVPFLRFFLYLFLCYH